MSIELFGTVDREPAIRLKEAREVGGGPCGRVMTCIGMECTVCTANPANAEELLMGREMTVDDSETPQRGGV